LRIPEPPKKLDPKEDDLKSRINDAMKVDVNCLGNTNISLFWEEKYILLIRIA